MRLKDRIKIALTLVLIVNFLGFFLISTINPEAYLFGDKLGGLKAASYLFLEGIIGVFVAFALWKGGEKGIYLAILFFGFNLIENLITNSLISFTPSPLFSIGLILSTTLLLIKES